MGTEELESRLLMYCTAPDWPSAASILLADQDLLLSDLAREKADDLLRHYEGREFELVPHRLSVLAQCRVRAPGDVLARLVTSSRLGPLAAQALQRPTAANAPQVVDSCSYALSLPGGVCSDMSSAYLQMWRATAKFLTVQTERNLHEISEDFMNALDVFTFTAYPEHWARTSQALGETWRRTRAGDRSKNLERAIALLRPLVSADLAMPQEERANVLNSLGRALMDRIAGDAVENRREARELLENAHTLFRSVNALAESAGCATNLLTLAVARRDEPVEERLLQAATWAHEAAVLYTRSNEPANVLRTHAALGAAFASHARLDEVPSFWDHAIDMVNLALHENWSALDRTDYAAAHLTLGAALLASDTRSDLQGAIAAFTAAIEYFDRSDEVGLMDVFNNRGQAFLLKGDYDRASADLLVATDYSDAALDGSLSIDNEMYIVSRLDELHSTAAIALLRLQRYEECLLKLEEGRARVLRRHLKPRPQSERIPTDGTLVADGYLVVAPVITNIGSVALIIPPGGDLALSIDNVVELPDLDRVALRRISVGDRSGNMGWVMYSIAIDSAETTEEESRLVREFISGIDDVVEYLGRSLIAPIKDKLKTMEIAPGTEIVLSVDGELAMTPLHAAPATDGATLGDDWPIIYTPSLTVFAESREHWPQRGWKPRVLGIVDPTGTLPFARVEIDNILDSDNSGALDIMEAGQIFADVWRHQDLLHIACHGEYEWEGVAGPRLMAEIGNPWTIDFIASLDLTGCRLAFLSACETGQTNFLKAKSEFLGLPGAFLQAGVGTVVCTLWRVDDFATAVVAERFYRELLGAANTVPVALRAAAAWLRNASTMDLLREIHWIDEDLSTALRVLPLETRPFAHPFYWAGFVALGGAG